MKSVLRRKLSLLMAGFVLAGAVVTSPAASAVAKRLEVDVWTSVGEDAVVAIGEPVDISFGATKRAHVIVFAIDSEGWVHLIYPSHARQDNEIRGRRTYRIREGGRSVLARSSCGVVLVGAVASRERLPLARWFASRDMLVFSGEESWCEPGILADPEVIGRVTGDPFEAVWAIEDALVPGGYWDRGVATDLSWYYVGRREVRPWHVCIDDRCVRGCDRDLRISVGLGLVVDWPRWVVRCCRKPFGQWRSCGEHGCRVESYARDRGCLGGEKIFEKARNKKTTRNVLSNERTKSFERTVERGNGPEAAGKPEGGRTRIKERNPAPESSGEGDAARVRLSAARKSADSKQSGRSTKAKSRKQ